MSSLPLYREIIDAIRQDIRNGVLQPDDELPTVRAMSETWRCAPGTVQRAYKELAAQGLVVARPGAGTRVAKGAPGETQTPLHRAKLINQAESFLLRMLAAGYTPDEISQAVTAALDRWRSSSEKPQRPPGQRLRFSGSHDPAASLIMASLGEHEPEIAYTGSLGGLMALARHEADLAGCHLWDEKTNTYNRAFIKHLMPGRRVALLTLANRHLGIIVAQGNPLGISGLADLVRDEVRFINRQEGAGTRVWLEAHLRQLDIFPDEIPGYSHEAQTHSEAAAAVVDGGANAGLGIETAAITYGLGFVPLTTERYEFAIPEDLWDTPMVQKLVQTLAEQETKAAIDTLGGYDTSQTGQFTWVE